MKLTATDNIIERSGIDNEQSFSIKASGKAFKILSDGLYSNKIGAVIRELSCNAFDSHVQAGKQNVPFQIHLPTSLEPWFSVKDFGVGLDHKDVIHLYSTYFESTKNQSNDFVGAFGLGSKSPFSYVDSFSVTSVFDKKRRAYTAFISEDGTPKISMVHEADTKEENSLEVQVPVKDQDIRTFKDNAKVFLKHFNPLPKTNMPDLDFEIKKPAMSGADWRYYYNDSRYNTKIILLQGHVAYPLDQSSFGNQSLPDHMRQLFNYSTMEIEFDIGQLEVAASREALSYNKETVKNIINKLKRVYNEVESEFKKYVEAIKGTEWEKNLKLREFKNANYDLFQMFDPNNKIIKNIILDVTKFPKLVVEHKGTGYKSNKQFSTLAINNTQVINFNPDRNQYFFIGDIRRPRTWFMNHLYNLGKDFRNCDIFVFYPHDHAMDEILDAIGNPTTVLKTSEIVRPPKKQREPRITLITSMPIPKVEGDNYWPCHWDGHTGPSSLPDGGLYLEIERNHVLYKTNRFDSYTDVMRKARKLKFFEDAGYKDIYLFKKNEMKYIANNPKWINAKDFIIAELDKWFSSNREEYAKYLDYEDNKLSSGNKDIFEKIQNHAGWKKIKNTSIHKMFKVYNKYSQIKLDSNIISLMLSIRYEPNVTDMKIESLKALQENIYKDFPLLNAVMDYSSYNIDDALIAGAVEYIDLIENKNKTLTE